MTSDVSLFIRCAEMIARSSGLLIAAGAGMGVDSGLVDFRGAEGFWRAYPPLRHAGLRFDEIANHWREFDAIFQCHAADLYGREYMFVMIE